MLVLIRHGEATANAAGLLLGRSDVPLTDKGRAQAEALGGRLRRDAAAADRPAAVRLVASPLRRAVDTADALGLDTPLEIDKRWLEVDYGEHEGRPLSDVPSEVWQRWRSDTTFRPPGGESLAELGLRVREACDELMGVPGESARSEEGDVIVVSHVSPIKAAVAWALQVDDGVAWHLYLANGSITRIGWGPAGPIVQGFNWTP